MPKKTKDPTYYAAVGRRKSAVAHVRLYFAPKASKEAASLKKGDIMVNGIHAQEYFQFAPYATLFEAPLRLVNAIGRFAISIHTTGGGKKGQLDAVRLGLARALEKADAGNRSILKPEKLLRRDPRVRERRKPATGGRARRKKQSPKR